MFHLFLLHAILCFNSSLNRDPSLATLPEKTLVKCSSSYTLLFPFLLQSSTIHAGVHEGWENNDRECGRTLGGAKSAENLKDIVFYFCVPQLKIPLPDWYPLICLRTYFPWDELFTVTTLWVLKQRLLTSLSISLSSHA